MKKLGIVAVCMGSTLLMACNQNLDTNTTGTTDTGTSSRYDTGTASGGTPVITNTEGMTTGNTSGSVPSGSPDSGNADPADSSRSSNPPAP